MKYGWAFWAIQDQVKARIFSIYLEKTSGYLFLRKLHRGWRILDLAVKVFEIRRFFGGIVGRKNSAQLFSK